MTVYRFQLSKFAVLGCIAGILLGLGAAGYTAYRIWRNLYSELSVQLVLQYAVVLLVAVLALVIFISVLAHSVYKITDKQIVLRFGIIKSVYRYTASRRRTSSSSISRISGSRSSS